MLQKAFHFTEFLWSEISRCAGLKPRGEDMNLNAAVWNSTWSFSPLICWLCNVFDVHTTRTEVFSER